MQTCNANELNSAMASGRPLWLLDVREPVEHAQVHIAGATLIPLGSVSRRLSEIPNDREIVIICKGGGRAKQAAQLLESHGYQNVSVLSGGTDAWVNAGLPAERGDSRVWSIERQVRFTAGALVFLGLFIPPWPWLTAAVAVGLMFSSVTNTCGMGRLLLQMPWNRVKSCGDRCSASK